MKSRFTPSESLLLPGAPCLDLSSQLPHPLCVSLTLSHFQLSSSFCLSLSNLPLYLFTLVLCWSVSFLLSAPFRLYLPFLTRWNSLRLPVQLESVWALARKGTMSRSTSHIGLRVKAWKMSLSSWGGAARKCPVWLWVGRATLVLVVLMVLALWATREGWGFGQDTVLTL